MVDLTRVERKGPYPNHLHSFHMSCILHGLLSSWVLKRALAPHRSRTPLDDIHLLSSVDERPHLSEVKVESRPHWPI